MKTCTGCKKELPKDNFHYLSGGNRHSRCNSCRKIYAKSYNKKRSQLQSKSLW